MSRVVNSVYGKLKPTDEQVHSVDLAMTGEDLKINALAGTGKTTNLGFISRAKKDERGLLVSFNSDLVKEAKKKFPHIECRTPHSLAWSVGRRYKSRLNRRLTGGMMASALGIADHYCDISPSDFGSLVLTTIRKYTQSDSSEIESKHVPWTELHPIEDLGLRQELGLRVEECAKRGWNLMIDLKGKLPITYDLYLKLWALKEPDLKRDYILFDEAQDASPVMLSIMQNQASCQKIFVGDRFQQIYSWRGAVNAMQSLDTKLECGLTKSFRFGQPIADIANTILNHGHGREPICLRGSEGVNSSVVHSSTPDLILSRTNASMINHLSGHLKSGDKVAIIGGCKDTISMLKGIKVLMNGKRTRQKDLALFSSWENVIAFSQSEEGSDLTSLVKLVQRSSISYLIKSLEAAEKTKITSCDVVLSTVHKAKGLEYPVVKLANDFRKEGQKNYCEEDRNILYVGATRAINQLDIGDCNVLKGLLESSNKKESMLCSSVDLST